MFSTQCLGLNPEDLVLRGDADFVDIVTDPVPEYKYKEDEVRTAPQKNVQGGGLVKFSLSTLCQKLS